MRYNTSNIIDRDRIPYHNPITFAELFTGAFVVAAIALTMVTSQGLRVARKNPAEVLRSE